LLSKKEKKRELSSRRRSRTTKHRYKIGEGTRQDDEASRGGEDKVYGERPILGFSAALPRRPTRDGGEVMGRPHQSQGGKNYWAVSRRGAKRRVCSDEYLEGPNNLPNTEKRPERRKGEEASGTFKGTKNAYGGPTSPHGIRNDLRLETRSLEIRAKVLSIRLNEGKKKEETYSRGERELSFVSYYELTAGRGKVPA